MKHSIVAAMVCLFIQNMPVISQMVEGTDIPEFGDVFGVDVSQRNYDVSMTLVHSTVPGNVLWPDDDAEFTLQAVNSTGSAIKVSGRIEVIAYGTRGRPGDIWTPQMFRRAVVDSVPVDLSLKPGAFENVTIRPDIPERFGAYALVSDLGGYGRQFLTSCVRTFSHPTTPLQYPSFCLDDNSPELLHRLGVQAIRIELHYKPTTGPDFDEWYQQRRQRFLRYRKNDIAVLVKISAPEAYGPMHPMGLTRPHLEKNGVMLNTKCDMAWLPAYDDDFKAFCYKIACEFGWPKGPVNGFSLWNEPWEGLSISGWGADMIRYRTIYIKMCEAIEAARRDAGVEILLGGGSSTSNALDKFFADGTETFLDRFDFCSIHYQGMQSWATIKKWVNRQSERGRVRIWDTESWVANTDDRVATVVASNKAAGYDRAMGIYRGNICHVRHPPVRTTKGNRRVDIVHAWSVAASIGAVQHFIGERPFRELLFKNGLPWIMVFEGLLSPDDGTVVVAGDIGEAFGANEVLYRTVRGLNEVAEKEKLRAGPARLDPLADREKIEQIKKRLNAPQSMTGSELVLQNSGGLFQLYDFYGNPVETGAPTITVPLDHRGFFLRTDGSPGSFQALTDALRASTINGFEPLQIIARDFLRPVERNPDLTLELTNMLNRPVSGTLAVRLDNLKLEKKKWPISFSAHETKIVHIPVRNNSASPDNSYPAHFSFESENAGIAVHHEVLHVNQIARQQIVVDGDLSDWSGVLPQTIVPESGGPRLTEAAWYPFVDFDTTIDAGVSHGYLAYDDDYIYFAAKVADNTPHAGMPRFSGRDNDACFYPDTCYLPAAEFSYGGAKKHGVLSFSVRWTGQLQAPVSGAYTLLFEHDDRLKCRIDGEQVVDHASGDQPEVATAFVELTADVPVDIRIDYSHTWGGDADVQLLWQYENGPIRVIPPQAFVYKESPGLLGHYYAGPYWNVKLVEQTDPNIDFSWPKEELPHPAYAELIPLVWPKGIRRYSYRKNPDLPCGNAPNFDNIQIAFNVLGEEEKDLLPHPPGVPKGFTNYQCTDYEYALNPVADVYGGGTEVWRLRKPGQPHKHFYPRQPASPLDGPVSDALLEIRHKGATRIVEAAIPWEEMPHVGECMRAGETIKFSFRVNDNTSGGCMELARGRSVSKINPSFYADWREHWANELVFSFEP